MGGWALSLSLFPLFLYTRLSTARFFFLTYVTVRRELTGLILLLLLLYGAAAAAAACSSPPPTQKTLVKGADALTTQGYTHTQIRPLPLPLTGGCCCCC